MASAYTIDSEGGLPPRRLFGVLCMDMWLWLPAAATGAGSPSHIGRGWPEVETVTEQQVTTTKGGFEANIGQIRVLASQLPE